MSRGQGVSEQQIELPDGWVWAPLGKIVTLNMGQSPKGVFTNDMAEGLPLIGGASDIDNGGPKPARYTSRPTKTCQRGDIIVCVRATIGKLAKADRVYCLGRGVAGIKPGIMNGDFIRWYLAANIERLQELGTGTTFKQISKDDLHAFPIPVAPLQEQQRITAKIEDVFKQSSMARQALDRIPPLLKGFRQSVLAAAFRGDLTRDWRESRIADLRSRVANFDPSCTAVYSSDFPSKSAIANPESEILYEPASVLLEHIQAERRRKWEENLRAKGKDPRKTKYEEPRMEDTTDLPELPGGWIWAKFGGLTSFVTSGSRGWAKYYSEGGPVFLRVGNLNHNSIALDPIQIVRVRPPDGTEGTRTRVAPGDILISITADVGMVGIVPEDIGEAYINQHLALARPVSGLLVSYIAYYLASDAGGQKQFAEMQYGMTKTGLNLANVQDVRIPFAPLSEQLHIVAQIEGLFAQAGSIEAAVELARRRAQNLEQSILTRAFRGELVAQDPNDEPASVLLGCIHGERVGEDRQIRPF
jgi:type I restriction enzyme S subunit